MRLPVIVGSLFILLLLCLWWKSSVQSDLKLAQINFYKTQKKLTMISKLKNNWSRKKLNYLEKTINASFKDSVESIEKNKAFLKISLVNLDSMALKRVTTKILNSNYKISNFDTKKNDEKRASFSFKVVP